MTPDPSIQRFPAGQDSNDTESRWPNFFIGGAPKCGTTAMARYLASHPQVFIPDLKEPFYWADDMPTMRAKDGIKTLKEYLRLFAGARAEHRVVGEGSTLYLYSETALAEIQQRIPEARFVFMIRRPSDIAHAYHMQMLFHEMEDEADFEKAWQLQDSRSRNIGIPARCTEPKLLQYQDIASTGRQLKRAFEIVGRDRVLVILFDDFVRDPREVYLKTLNFLGIEDDGRNEFPKSNTAMKPRFKLLSRVLRSGPSRRATRFFKRVLSGPAYSVALQGKQFLNRKDAKREVLSSDFKAALCEAFADDISLLEGLIQRDLSEWKKP